MNAFKPLLTALEELRAARDLAEWVPVIDPLIAMFTELSPLFLELCASEERRIVLIEESGVEVLERLWQELDATLHAELQASGQPLGAYLKARHTAWNLVGRVHVHLAENRKDEQFPFAFLATYTTRLSAQGKAQQLLDMPVKVAVGLVR